MSKPRISKNALLRASALAGAGAFAMAAASAAQAGTVNSITLVSVQNVSANVCRATVEASLTGTNTDTTGRDWFQVGFNTSAGQRFNQPNVTFVQPGNTETQTIATEIAISSAPRTDYVINVYDTTSSTTNANAGPIIGSVSVPRQTLVNAGGACQRIATNSAPVSDAGPDQTVTTLRSTVTLDGTGSTDPDGDAITYSWGQIGGTPVTLSGANTANPTFTAKNASTSPRVLTFRLVTTDQFFGTIPSEDEVRIFLPAGPNDPPDVDAGPNQSVAGESTNTFSPTVSDPNGDSLTYQWTQISGPPVTIVNATSENASFTAPPTSAIAQTLVFELRADDGKDDEADTVTYTVLANQAPTAVITGPSGDQDGGTTITLDGSSSTDPEGQNLFYNWTQISGPSVVINNSQAAQMNFVAPAATSSTQTLVFQLLTADPLDAADTETFTVNIGPNRAPVADAGADAGPFDAGTTVTLDGTGSTDPDGDTLTYSWVQTSGTPVTLDDPNTATPQFVAPNVNENLEFTLTVSDGQTSSSDSVDIQIRAVGTITLVQRISGPDTTVAFTSGLAALTANITTSNGIGQFTAGSIATGTYTVTAEDLSAEGYAVTDIMCDDDDSTGDIASRSATINLAAGEDVTCTFSSTNSRGEALAAIHRFLTGRNALILANQPNLQRRIDRLSSAGGSMGDGPVSAYGMPVPGSEHLPIEATIGREGAQFSTSLASALGPNGGSTFDIWAEGHITRATIGEQEADFRIFHIGADVKVTDNLLIGAIVQRDYFDDRDTFDVGEAEGDGWMVGPYITARLAPGLFVEARAAWGKSENRVSPLAGMIDEFDTSRSLYSGSVVGQIDLDDATVFRPELTLRYLSEDQEAYTDSLGIDIPSQTVDQGDISFRPRISHLVALDSGWSLRPYGEVEGIYTFGTTPDGALATLVPDSVLIVDELRARVEGGLDVFSSGSFRATASIFHDGIGANNFNNTGLQVGISFGF